MCSYTNIDVKQVVCHWVLYSIINVNVMNTSDTKTHIQQDHTGIVLNILDLAIYSLSHIQLCTKCHFSEHHVKYY